MNKRTLEKLEYNKIILMLEEKASSFAGKRLCANLQPTTDLSEITSAQEETKAAFSRLIKKGTPSFASVKPLGEPIKRLLSGAILSDVELLNIAKLLGTSTRLKSYGNHDTVDELADCLDDYFNELDGVPSLEREIRACILDEGVIADDASPALKNIRRQIAGMNDRIHTALNQMINGQYRAYLQDSLITMRGDRYCIPVKAEYKNKVSGIVHDQSSKGSTLFIEPTAVVRLGNELTGLFAKEQDEIQKILAELSEKCAEVVETIQSNEKVLTTLDFIFAKGNLAIDMNASMPIFNKQHYIHIRQGRHPLLDKKKVVPITVTLGETFNLLIVTGPNTGGKTVSLKTVGLFTLMGQSGLHIPALDRSELGIFHEVYADIGDEQSIEQSLSTFSSHMTNIVSFLNHTSSNDLVLFDELGAGTDPIEGAALATAILENLHQREVRTMATTHYSELKVYALTTDGVENASCEFDVATLRPTYRLLIGIPGKSNAFAIASKLGLSDNIIDAAKTHLTKQDESLEDLMSDLETARQALSRDQDKWAFKKRDLEKKEKQLNDRYNSADKQKAKILEEAKEEAKKILSNAKDVADDTIKLFNKAAASNTTVQELELKRSQLREELKKTNNKHHKLEVPTKPKKQYKPSDFTPGTYVKVLSMNINGTVHKAPDNKGLVEVQMGILKSRIPMTDLEILREPETLTPKNFSRAKSSKMDMNKSFSIRPEINLLGKNVDEAISLLDKYLDDAYLAHLQNVRIVHGKGTGALRAGIHQYLKHQSHVDSFKLGEFGEGDAGVTIVTFK
jgi:DNA mismatch repair protein MutS2